MRWRSDRRHRGSRVRAPSRTSRLAVSVGNFSRVAWYERQIGLDLRAPCRRPDPGQAGLGQDPRHGAVGAHAVGGQSCPRAISRHDNSAEICASDRAGWSSCSLGEVWRQIEPLRRAGTHGERTAGSGIHTVAVPSLRAMTRQWPRSVTGARWLACDRHRARHHQNHRAMGRGTLMRHVVLSGAIASGPCRRLTRPRRLAW